MHSQNEDDIWSDFLAEKKKQLELDPAFTAKVMASVRALAGNENLRQMPQKVGFWTEYENFFKRIFSSIKPEPLFAFTSLAFAFVLVTLFPFQKVWNGRDSMELTRIKGEEFKIGFLLKRDSKIVNARSGDLYQPGDKLQVYYSTSSLGYLNLYSLDQFGKIICFSCQEQSRSLPPGQEKTLDFALELDNSTTAEILIGYWSSKPILNREFESKLLHALKLKGFNLFAIESQLSSKLKQGDNISLFLLNKKAVL